MRTSKQIDDSRRPGRAVGPTGTAADEDLCLIEEALGTIVREAKSRRYHERISRIGAVSLEAATYPILRHAAETGPLRLSDLADALGVDLSTASRQVRDLEDTGLVARSPDPADGRAALIAITDTGRRVLADFRKARRRRVADLLDGWSADDRSTLARLLTRLAAGVTEQSERA